MTTLNLLELAAALTAAQDAINAQSAQQPRITALEEEVHAKLDHIAKIEESNLNLNRENDRLMAELRGKDDEVSTLRRERDDHGLEAMALRDELDTLKANIDRALGAATETFYSTMQMKPQATVNHEHKPIEDVKPVEMLPILADEPTSFDEPEPSYGDVVAWSSWNKRRVDWNNKITNGPDANWSKVVHSVNTYANYYYA